MENNFIKCSKCTKPIPTNSNYCYLCGEAISDMAKQNEKIKLQNAQLLLLNRLSSMIEDANDLEILKGVVYQIKNS